MRRRALLLALVLLGGPGAARGEVRLAVAAPLTGVDSVFGAQMRTGVELAVADLNAAGGLLGEPVSLVSGDDGSDPKRGRALATRFVADGIRLVVGDFSSSVTLAALDVYAAAGALVITPGATSPQVTERGAQTLFRVIGRDDVQALVAAEALQAAGTRIGLLHDRTTYGQGLAEATRRRLAAAGVTEAFFDGVAADERDLGPVLARLDAAGVETLFFTGNAPEAAVLARALPERGRGPRLLCTDVCGGEEFATAAGPAAAGVAFTFPADPQDLPAAAGLLQRLAARNIPPAPATILAYAAVETLKAAAIAAGSRDPAAMAAALHGGTPVPTALGALRFDAAGDRSPPEQRIYTWRRGPDGRPVFRPAGS